MKNNAVSRLQANITKRYVIALSIIAILSSVAFVILLSALKGSEDTAYVVNISGKQRMLSQTIALDVFRLYQLRNEGYYNDPSITDYKIKEVIARMSKNMAEMESVNDRLSNGLNSQDLGEPPQKISAELTALYFGEANLAQQVRDYLAKVRQCIQSDQPSRHDLHQVSMMAPALLANLHHAVELYQKEGEQKLAMIQQVKTYVWLITLFMLLLEVIFIFQPMVRQIIYLARENQLNMKNLEQKVRLRTLNLEQSNEKLHKLASLDPLTGLLNRLYLEQNIEKQLVQSKEHHAPFAVFMLDIDHFKQVNDTYGHDAGDFVLVEVAKLLKSLVRQDDTVYRAGGEEFVVLLARISLEDAWQKAELIRQTLENYPLNYNDNLIHKTLSIGVYHSSVREMESVKDLLMEIDAALYKSKNQGRNKVTMVD